MCSELPFVCGRKRTDSQDSLAQARSISGLTSRTIVLLAASRGNLAAGEQDWMGGHRHTDSTCFLSLKIGHEIALKLNSFCQHLVEEYLSWDLVLMDTLMCQSE